MSNTLKLGNGQWATGKDTILAYNDLNSNYKPLAFSFSRDTSATVINKDGLIETVGSGEPRIDFKDNTKGALLLEPSRTNYLPQSNTFSIGWAITGTGSSVGNSVSGAFPNLDGTSITLASGGLLYYSITPISSGVMSIYMRVPSGTVDVQLGDPIGSPYDTKTLTTTWQRFSTVDTGSLGGLAIYNSQSGTTITIEVSAAQVESGSYPTSYIPTSGSAVTRVADFCNNGGNEQVINSTEGVLYAEISALANDLTSRYISINQNTSERVVIRYSTVNNQVQAFTTVAATTQANITHTLTNQTDLIKIAFKYKLNDFSLWINGVEVGTDTSGSVSAANSFDNLTFDQGNGAFPFYGNVKDIKLYNTTLTDQELIALTTI